MRKKVLDVIDELQKLVNKNPKGPIEIGYNLGVIDTINEIKKMYKIKDEQKND